MARSYLAPPAPSDYEHAARMQITYAVDCLDRGDWWAAAGHLGHAIAHAVKRAQAPEPDPEF